MFVGIVLTGSIGVLGIVLAVALLGNEALPAWVSEVMLGIVLLGMLVITGSAIWKIAREQSRP